MHKFQIIIDCQMDNLSQEDTNYHEVQGTIIIPVNPANNKGNNPLTPKKSRRKHANQKVKSKISGGYQQAQDSSYNDDPQQKEGQRNSQGKMRGVDQETMVELQDNGLVQPYEFLSQRSPSILSIFFPRFTIRSINFWLSIVFAVMFVILIIYNYSRSQTDLSWNCSLFKLQAKYFPKIRYGSQVWRVITSVLLHSNIAHFCLDFFAIHVYGYFIEWYLGKLRFSLLLVSAMIYSHFFGCLIEKLSVSTTSSALLYAMIGVKAIFLWEYRQYKRLREKRIFLIMLLVLIGAINLIPIFVANNIDYSSHIGGFFVGACFGIQFLFSKQEVQGLKTRFMRFGLMILMIISFIIYLALVFGNTEEQYASLAKQIGPRCQNN